MPLSQVPREKKPAAFILVNSDVCGVFVTQWGGIVSGGRGLNHPNCLVLPLGWNGSDPQRRRRARSAGLGLRSLPCSRPMGVCFALCNSYDLSLDGTNVVFRSQQYLQPPHPCAYRDYIADFRKLVDINRIIFLAG